MPPDIYQQPEVRSPPRAVDTMDESFDLVVDDAPVPQHDHVSESRMIQMFEIQQEQLRVVVHDELNKRIPLSATSATNEKSHMIFDFWNQIVGRSSGNQNPQEIIDQLLHENQQLQWSNKSLQGEITAAKQQSHKLNINVNAARHDLNHERAKNEKLKERMASLRQMLVPPPEIQISDTEVIQRFTGLRSLILRLVKTTWTKKLRDNISESDLSEGQRTFVRPYAGKDAMWKSLHNRIRYFVFYQLCKFILGQRIYGLVNDYRMLDEGLGAIETYIWEQLPKESHGMLIDWRIATMKVTEPFRDDQRSVSLAESRNAHRHIWNFLNIFATNGAQAEKKGEEMLEQICNDAVDLSMLMRKAKDDLYVDSMESAIGRPISEWESFVEEEASEAVDSSDKKPQTIAYIITEALMKHPKENPQEKKVLEKAQAVVYK